MTRKTRLIGTALGAATLASFLALGASVLAQSGARSMPQNPPVPFTIRDDIAVPQADEKTQAIVAAAQSFLDTLNDEQHAAALFAFDDREQRANWSNFPDPVVPRKGVMRGEMSEVQRLALDGLLAEVLSPAGMDNLRWQLAADDASDEGSDFPRFGADYYYVAFLGEPAADAPWMLQFGGHHLAINATVVGPDISFSPMLTGGEPLHLTVDGGQVFITEAEVNAAGALWASLSPGQQGIAKRSERNGFLMLGPGEDSLKLAPEGLPGSAMNEGQKALFLTMIAARLGFFNADDFAAKMAQVEAELDQTFVGWWGGTEPGDTPYVRVTGPSIVLEYSPETQGSSSDHAHNMYRDPSNDYGAAWIAE